MPDLTEVKGWLEGSLDEINGEIEVIEQLMVIQTKRGMYTADNEKSLEILKKYRHIIRFTIELIQYFEEHPQSPHIYILRNIMANLKKSDEIGNG